MDPAAEAAVLDQSRRIDAGTAALRRASGLACPPGCGRCCLSTEVHASEPELRPLARALWETGEAEAWLARLAAAGDGGRCVLYEPDPADPTRGRCAHYAWRPPVCRLFGFAARRTRDGRRELAACRVHREVDPDAVARAAAAIAAGTEAPELSSATAALAGLEAGPGHGLLPINAALRRALASIGLARRLAGELGLPGDDPRPPEERPPRPSAPKRAA